MTFDEIDSTVKYLVDLCKTNLPFKICDKLKINIFFIDLPRSTNGLFVKTKDDKKIILINRFAHKNEFHKICSHELGHAILHHSVNAVCLEDNTKLLKRLDEEAEHFSEELSKCNYEDSYFL